MVTAKHQLLNLTLISGIGPTVIHKLLEHPNFESLYSFGEQDFRNFGFSERISNLLVSGLKDKSVLEKELALIERWNIKIISVLDSAYPSCLKEIYLAPPILYSMGGELEQNKKRIAIVGSRNCSDYGISVVKNLVSGLVDVGYEIVSGGAIGIDAAVHDATLKFSGKTIAVLGSGVINPYPSENIKLFREIISLGSNLISPFKLSSLPSKGNFPARNRIISGLSDGVIVVQASQKSGAIITAKFALEQGREIFAVPGSIFDELSVGCNELIKQGAKLVAHVNDVLEELGDELVQSDIFQPASLEKVNLPNNASVQEKLLFFLNEPTSIDELSAKVEVEISELRDMLFNLQLEGVVTQDFIGNWRKSERY